jgi:hypothetical protein
VPEQVRGSRNQKVFDEIQANDGKVADTSGCPLIEARRYGQYACRAGLL